MKRITGIIKAALFTFVFMFGIIGMGYNVQAASPDNSLQSLSLSEGSLSPSFVYNQMSYTATVDADTTRVDVNAKVSNELATIKSITGNENLTEGDNTISITVTAENGAEATYTIKVTRGGQTASDADANNTPAVTDNNATDNNATDNNADDNTDTDNNEAEPAGTTETPTTETPATEQPAEVTEPAEGTVSTEEYNELNDSYTFLQKSYNDLNETYTARKARDMRVIIGLIVAVAILVILCLNLFIGRRRGGDDEDDDEDDHDEEDSSNEDDYEEDEEFLDFEEEPGVLSKRRDKKEKNDKKKRKAKRKADIFDDGDDDFYDDEAVEEEKPASIDAASALDDDLEILDLNDL